MQTIVIEILRNGKAYNKLLDPDINYIALCGTNPGIDFNIECEQQEFFEQSSLLRYDNTDNDSVLKAIDFFKQLVTKILNDIGSIKKEVKINDNFLHLRLVMAPIELAQLPFELSLTPDGLAGEKEKFFLRNSLLKTVITREVRQVSFIGYSWPVKPKILFAWAQPINTVPYKLHWNALIEILKPLALPFAEIPEPIPDLGKLIKEIKQASLQSIKDEIAKAAMLNEPYTHVHLLAHGGNENNFGGVQWRLVLCDNSDDSKAYFASGEELQHALIPETGNTNAIPVIVSIIACDSGNEGSPVLPGGSLAHQLHVAGIPCVYASQFPLTQDGSVKLVSSLYSELIGAKDPRMTLYRTREVLDDGEMHDWASFVAYARFPADINTQLAETRLKQQFEPMKITAKWADHVLINLDKIGADKIHQVLKDIDDRLSKSIVGLEEQLDENGNSTLASAALKAEHFGLLGSAFKRKAEHLFNMAKTEKDEKEILLQKSIEALRNSALYYKKGFDADPSSHWNAMQYLSLKAVSGESLTDDITVCTVISFMAERDVREAKKEVDKIWAWGTLAELYLLQPLTVPIDQQKKVNEEAMLKANEYLSEIKKSGQDFQIESTTRQLDRYINWWPIMLPSAQMEQLKNCAVELRKVI